MLKSFSYLAMVLLGQLCWSQYAAAQKTVSAVISFAGKDTAIQLGKNQTFVWELWVPNRKGYEWRIARPAANTRFLQSQIGQAATMPGTPEQQIWFFKTQSKGTDSLKMVYISPYARDTVQVKTLHIRVE